MKLKYILLMMLATLGLSCHAGIITQHISMPEESPTLTIAEVDGEEFTVVNWADVERESEPGRLALPVTTLTLRVPTYSKDFTVSTSNVTWGNPISLDLPFGMVSEKISSAPMALTAETKSKIDKTGQIPVLSAEVVNEYFLNWTEHYVMVRIDCVFPIDSTNIIPLQSADIQINYSECSVEEMSFNIPSREKDIAQSEANKSVSLEIGIPLDRYIIITTEDLIEGCHKLALWKAQKGLAVQVYTIEQILSGRNYKVGTNGIMDEADALRRYLKTVCNPEVDNYCLFIGPSDKLPLRYFYNSSPQNRPNPNDNNIAFDNFVPSDLYYSDLVNDWNLEDDPAGVYAIPCFGLKYSPNIYIGRLVCNCYDEINNYLHKLIYYEADPGMGDYDYLGKALLTQQSDLLGRKDMLTSLGTYSKIIALLDNEGGTFDSNLPRGCDVIQAMKQVGIISLQGHGVPGSIACSGPEHIDGKDNRCNWRYIKVHNQYTSEEVGYSKSYNVKEELNSGLDLLDNIYRPSVIYTVSCDIMPFDEYGYYRLPYNMGTAYTVAGLYGGVAMLGNTRSGYRDANEILEKQFAIDLKSQVHTGKAHAFARATARISGYAKAAHNIMGDPEFCIWQHTPKIQDFKLTLTDYSLQAIGSTLPNSTIVLFDGVHPPTKLLPTGTSYSATLTRMNIDNNFFSTAIWKAGALPYISILTQKAELNNSSRSFIVHDASFGAAVNPAKSTGECVIGQNAMLNVTALKSLNIAEGFRVTVNGRANFRCVKDIFVSGGVIESASTVNLNGGDVVISGNFIITQGAELQINNNPDIINPFAYGTN